MNFLKKSQISNKTQDHIIKIVYLINILQSYNFINWNLIVPVLEIDNPVRNKINHIEVMRNKKDCQTFFPVEL